jgi:hypothetical protein
MWSLGRLAFDCLLGLIAEEGQVEDDHLGYEGHDRPEALRDAQNGRAQSSLQTGKAQPRHPLVRVGSLSCGEVRRTRTDFAGVAVSS